MRRGGRRLLAVLALAIDLLVADEGAEGQLEVNCQGLDAPILLENNQISYSCGNNNNDNDKVATGVYPEVDVRASTFTLTLGNNDAIETLKLVGFGSGGTPTLRSDSNALNFGTFPRLRSLTFQNLGFAADTLTLTLPSTTNDIHFVDATLNDLSLEFSSSSNNLTQIDMSGSTVYWFPSFLYKRNFSQTMNITVSLTSVNKSTTLSAEENSTLEANLLALSTQPWVKEYNSLCNSPALSSNGDTAISCNSDSLSTTTNSSSSSSKADYSSPAGESGTSRTSNQSGSGSASKPDTGSSGIPAGALVAIIVVVVVIALVLAFFIMRMYFKRKAANAGTHSEATTTLMSKGDASGDKGSFISNDEFLRNFRLPQSDVSLIKSVGTGRLWMGEYNDGKIIVKRVESEVTDSYVTKALMAQARTFATISHPNITNLVGVTWLAGTDFAVVTEFMDKGNLKTVLSNSDVNLDVSTKLQMCLDVAEALAYLHETEQNLCAKQLSSRKVLVNSAMTCKLSLFECVPCSAKLGGPSTDAVYSYGMGEVVWLPPEVITRSSPMDARKNNIYAFGVLVSEIFTRLSPCQTLIEEQGNTMSDVELVKRVRRQEPMVPHENRREYMEAPVSVRQLVEQCLSYAPMSRPTAKDLVDCLHNAKEELQTNSI